MFLAEFFLVTEADAGKLFRAVMGSTVQLVQKEVCSAGAESSACSAVQRGACSAAAERGACSAGTDRDTLLS